MAMIRTGGRVKRDLLPNQQQVNQPRPIAITGLVSKPAALNASNPARPPKQQRNHRRLCGCQSSRLKLSETWLMDKPNQTFVIAARTIAVVGGCLAIAIGGTWLY